MAAGEVMSKNRWTFDPRQITGCVCWLDAADSSTITGNPVTTWRDKSSSGFNATSAAGPTVSTFNGYPVLTFNGTSQFLGSSLTIPRTTHTFIGVHVPTSRDKNVCLFMFNDATMYINFPYWDGTTARGYCTNSGGSGVGSLDYGNSTLVENSVNARLNIVTAVIQSGSQLIYNSSTQQSSAAVALSGGTSSATFLIGKAQGGAPFYGGSVGEILIYNRAIGFTERQQIEGYLAWKWGLAAGPITKPLEIPGCSLWLDAADSSTMTLSGTSIIQWNDKSGRGLDVSGTANFPVLVTGALNSSNVVSYNGTQNLFRNISASMIAGNNTTTFSAFVVCSLSNTSVASSMAYAWQDAANANNRIIVTVFVPGSGIQWDFGTLGNQFRTQISNAVFTPAGNVYYVYSFVMSNPLGTAYTSAGLYSASNAALTNVNFASASGRLNIGWNAAFSSTNGYNMNGRTAEIIMYSNALTTQQRQQIETYLVTKWSLNTVRTGTFALDNPYYIQTPYSRLFNPLDVSGCHLWLDGADIRSMFQDISGTNPVTANGQSVALWMDKSGVFNHATASANQPTTVFNAKNNQAVVSFNGTTQNLSLSPVLMPTGTLPSTYFFVVYPTSTSGQSTIFTLGSNAGGAAEQIYTGGSTATLAADIRGAGVVSDTTSNLSNYVLASVVFSSSNAGWRNGTAFSTTNVAATLNTGTTSAYLGQAVSAGYYGGYIAEGIGYNRALSSNERQTIEGYLAWKWGIALTSHPFTARTVPAPAFTPRNISGCQLWLDGADPSYMSLSGTNILLWKDKSGFGRDASANTSRFAQYSSNTNQFNSRIAPYFSNLSRYLFPAFTPSSTGAMSFFIVGVQTEALPVGSNAEIFTADSTVHFNFRLSNLAGYPIHTYSGGTGSNGAAYASLFLASNNTPFNACATVTAVTAGNSSRAIYVNGASYGSASGINVSGNTLNASRTFRISGGANTNMVGNVCEIIMYNTVLNTTDRQRVEGYLAQKWGMLSDLSAGHPYQKVAT